MLRAALGLAWRAGWMPLSGWLLVTIITGIAPVAAAWLMRQILDALAYGDRELVTLILALALAGGLQAVLPYVSQYLGAQSGRAVQRRASAHLMTAVAGVAGLRRLEDPGYRDRLNLAEQVGQDGPGQIVMSLAAILQSAVTVSGFLATVLLLSPLMAAVLVGTTIPEIIIQLRLSRDRAQVMRAMTPAQRRQMFYSSLLSDHAAATEMRLFRLGPFFLGRMLKELEELQQAGQRADRRSLAGYGLLGSLSAIVAGFGLWWAVAAASAGAITLGDVTVFVVAIMTVTVSLSQIIGSAAAAYQSVILFRSYSEIVTAEPDLSLPARPRPVRPLRDGIEIDDVWFRYGPDQPWVLRGFSLFIPRGQTISLVGLNGAGKSTLIKLLCRFYDPDRGRIRWDGADLRDLDLAGLREHISAVFQDFMRYELDVSENIGVGDLELADQPGLVTAAAGRAGLDVAALPYGYRTLLTCNYFDLADRDDPRTGVLLSGGQWQRLALARAFLRGSRDLMILDEPSAGLDAQAEYDIHNQLRANGITILISHRLSSARSADRIVVLADGRVAEDGTHEELIAAAGEYARLFLLQARGFAEVAG
ncbi:MAG TPA: ABC transporter ATP-binding protein [Streptosporangiaceae bacterium]|nr:ABC transporter ATP-binding protein [Streptosporangiaceae bacterium]